VGCLDNLAINLIVVYVFTQWDFKGVMKGRCSSGVISIQYIALFPSTHIAMGVNALRYWVRKLLLYPFPIDNTGYEQIKITRYLIIWR